MFEVFIENNCPCLGVENIASSPEPTRDQDFLAKNAISGVIFTVKGRNA